MKQLTAFALCLLLVLGLTACGPAETPETPDTPAPAPTQAPAAPAPTEGEDFTEAPT